MEKERKVTAVISYVRGILAEKLGTQIIVEAGQIGFGIHVPMSVLEALPPLGEEVRIYTHMQVKEDDMSLYGFLSRQDLEMFRQLIGVNGIGPKGALGILSALRPDELRMAIVSGDAKAISKAPGVGAKTAQRVILDLKDKIHTEDLLSAVTEERGPMLSESPAAGAAKEAVEALMALGYSAAEASKAVKSVPLTEEMDAEAILKASLKYLAFL